MSCKTVRLPDSDHSRVRGPAEASSEIQGGEEKSIPTNRPNSILERPHLLEGRSILVAEDNDDMWRVTEIFLSRAGADAERATNGKEAVEKAIQHLYSAILMDMQMPVMDGLEATRQIRAKGVLSPILAFTTNPQSSHAAESIVAGCNEHLTKPLSWQLLVDKIAAYCADNDSRTQPKRGLIRADGAMLNPPVAPEISNRSPTNTREN